MPQVKIKFISLNDTQASNIKQSATICLSGQPVLKAHFNASSMRDRAEWAWVVSVVSTAAAVWTERMCEIAGDAAQNACAVF